VRQLRHLPEVLNVTRKAGPRRKYAADPTSWARVIAGHWEIDRNHSLRVEVKVRAAYQRMKDGNGDENDFDVLAFSLNLCMPRAEKIGAPVVAAIKAGMDALMEADGLRERHGQYGFTGPGILAMNAAVGLYAEMLANSTPRQMQEAMQEADRRQRAAKAGQNT
jgi:hypothetical protein